MRVGYTRNKRIIFINFHPERCRRSYSGYNGLNECLFLRGKAWNMEYLKHVTHNMELCMYRSVSRGRERLDPIVKAYSRLILVDGLVL